MVENVVKLGGTLEFTKARSWIHMFVPKRFEFLFDRVEAIDSGQQSDAARFNLSDNKPHRLQLIRCILDDIDELRYLKSLDLRETEIDDSDLVNVTRAPRL